MNAKTEQQRTSCDDVSNLRDRVNRSLHNLGYQEARFVNAVNQTITLTCPMSNRNDQCVMSVAIRLLPGVSAVKFVSQIEANR